jgi:2-keto-3-deoxy-L-rhamnonate aldolase RhmA
MEFISITNQVQIAEYFEQCGIDDIMVDLEIIGKSERQKGLNTVISAHSIEDVEKIKKCLKRSKCLVRINPIHQNSEAEIEQVIERKADIIMLPMFTTAEEVKVFINRVDNRALKYLLLETPQALTRIDDILAVEGIDAIHIGLNDLSIGMGLTFLYEPLIGGIVEYLAHKIVPRKIKFGFGGASRLEKGKNIISEHVRLGSQMVILNRDFRNYKETLAEIRQEVDLEKEIKKILQFVNNLEKANPEVLEVNRLRLIEEIKMQISKKGL